MSPGGRIPFRPISAMYTAATWFHRFYMRYSMEDYHRQVRALPFCMTSLTADALASCQDVAASCIFLATKTEECGRKLRDVAKVFYSKVAKIDINDISDDNKVGVHVASAWQITDGKQELETYQTAILLTEEALLEALCFDFVVDSPHAELVDLVAARQDTEQLTECAWSIANDT